MDGLRLMEKQNNIASLMLVVGCILFGLGSLIVKFVPVGAYAIAFWRLLIASGIFYFLMKLANIFRKVKRLYFSPHFQGYF